MKARISAVAAVLSTVFLLQAGKASGAVSVAADTADNSMYDSGNFNRVNGGYGFTPFANDVSATGGAFVNASSYDATGLPGRVFDIYDNGGPSQTLNSGITTVTRGFATPLAAGDTFSFADVLHYANGPDGNGSPTSSLGFSLVNASGIDLLTLAVGGGAGGYALTDENRSGEIETNIPYNYESTTTFAVTLNDATGDYTLTADGATYTGTINVSGGLPTAAAFFNNDGGFQSDLQFSNLSITAPSAVPEPASMLAIVGLIAPLVGRRRRQ